LGAGHGVVPVSTRNLLFGGFKKEVQHHWVLDLKLPFFTIPQTGELAHFFKAGID
jgi:hypothetical protein